MLLTLSCFWNTNCIGKKTVKLGRMPFLVHYTYVIVNKNAGITGIFYNL